MIVFKFFPSRSRRSFDEYVTCASLNMCSKVDAELGHYHSIKTH